MPAECVLPYCEASVSQSASESSPTSAGPSPEGASHHACHAHERLLGRRRGAATEVPPGTCLIPPTQHPNCRLVERRVERSRRLACALIKPLPVRVPGTCQEVGETCAAGALR